MPSRLSLRCLSRSDGLGRVSNPCPFRSTSTACATSMLTSSTSSTRSCTGRCRIRLPRAHEERKAADQGGDRASPPCARSCKGCRRPTPRPSHDGAGPAPFSFRGSHRPRAGRARSGCASARRRRNPRAGSGCSPRPGWPACRARGVPIVTMSPRLVGEAQPRRAAVDDRREHRAAEQDEPVRIGVMRGRSHGRPDPRCRG